MSAQLLTQHRKPSAAQVVAHLGGVQAQDYAGAKWSVGIRLSDTGEDAVQRAIAEGEIMRTWVYRGTLHLISTAAAPWLLRLIAPSVIAANQRRYRELGLDETMLKKSNCLIREILESEDLPVARSKICKLLEINGISTGGQKAHYLLQRAGLDGLLCLGPNRGHESTCQPAPIEPGSAQIMKPGQAMMRLGELYFAGHGPAAIQDFSWWSGLPLTLVRKALAGFSSPQPLFGAGKQMWAGEGQTAADPASLKHSVFLLPPFDEYLLGYKDRSAALDPAFVKKVNAGGGMMKPTVIVNGKVAGVWKQTRRKDRIMISVDPFRKLLDREYRVLARAADRYGRFYNTAAELAG